MKEFIKKIPPKLRVCLSVFIIGLIMLISALYSSVNPISVVLVMIGGIATITGVVSLIVYWMEWAEK